MKGENMKTRICFILAATVLSVCFTGCGPKDQPMPLSMENLEKMASEVEKAMDSYVPSEDRDSNKDGMIQIYRTAIEKKMGYSFDKTLRMAMLAKGEVQVLMATPILLVAQIISENPKKALEKGFISQRTFGLIEAQNAAGGTALTETMSEFLAFVTEAQQQNGGVCDSKALLKVLVAHNVVPADLPVEMIGGGGPPTERDKLDSYSVRLGGKYETSKMGTNEFIVAPDGTDFNTIMILSNPEDRKFVVNQKKVDAARKYAAMLAEEKAALSK